MAAARATTCGALRTPGADSTAAAFAETLRNLAWLAFLHAMIGGRQDEAGLAGVRRIGRFVQHVLKRVVAHVAQATDFVLGAGDGEIPGEKQRLIACHTHIRPRQHREHVLFECGAALCKLRQLRVGAVAIADRKSVV